jgi:hypothetical protein
MLQVVVVDDAALPSMTSCFAPSPAVMSSLLRINTVPSPASMMIFVLPSMACMSFSFSRVRTVDVTSGIVVSRSGRTERIRSISSTPARSRRRVRFSRDRTVPTGMLSAFAISS